HQHAGDFHVRKDRGVGRVESHWQVPRHRGATEVLRSPARRGHPASSLYVRGRGRGAVMITAVIVFVIVTGAVAVFTLRVWASVSTAIEKKRLDERLREVGQVMEPTDSSIIRQLQESRLSGVEKLIARTSMGPSLSKLIEQSGTNTTPSTIAVYSAFCAFAVWFITRLFVHVPYVAPISLMVGGSLPTLWLRRRRTVRLHKFEEQFPEALDILSRAMRA